MRARWYALLALPFIGLLTPVYLTAEPSLAGFPFFYWYQFAWLIFTAFLTWIVYVKTRGIER
ncbi:MAG TPA: DUF3311 domain-containing protein [Candidatus Limnocylindria bacterium]|jgi:hypothetical protein|nr:DUF3311 domain-containing protein [Candidatus Limnocylindria bacterium]